MKETTLSTEIPLRRNRDFRLLWVSGATSQLGSQAAEIAFPLLLLAVTGSAGYAGLLTSAQMVTYLVIMLPAGVLADRFDRRKLMLVSNFSRAGLLAIITAMVLFDYTYIVPLIIVAMLISLMEAVFDPTQDASLKQLVSVKQLNDAYAVDQARTQAATLIGPVVGGWLYAVGRWVPFLGNMLAFLASGFMIWAIKRPLNSENATDEVGTNVGWRGAFEGFKFLFSDPLLRAVALLSTGTMFTLAAFPLIYIASLRADNVGSQVIGIMLAAYGVAGVVGAVLSPFILRVVPSNLLFFIATWLVPIVLVVLAMTNYIPVAIGGACLLFFSLPPVTALARGYLSAITPSHLQGRVFASVMVVGAALQPIAPVVFGTVFDSAGRFWTFLGMAIAGTITATISLTKPIRNAAKPG